MSQAESANITNPSGVTSPAGESVLRVVAPAGTDDLEEQCEGSRSADEAHL